MIVDHIAIWTREAAAMADDLARRTGRAVLEGWRPGGKLKAWGLRFANGPFLDLHMPPPDAPERPVGRVLLGLGGGIDLTEQLGATRGWRLSVERRVEGADTAPWSIASFRRNQGVLSEMFVIEYAADPAAFEVPEYAGALYRPTVANGDGPRMRRVWLQSADLEADGAELEALGFARGGVLRSAFPPFEGAAYRSAAGDLVLCAGPQAEVVRIDVDRADPAAPPERLTYGDRFSLVCGETL